MDKMSGIPRIAILMTCHNRRDTTINCLKRIYSQSGIDSTQLKVFLVDDGSSDGTGTAVRDAFPKVTVLAGDGSLYWVGGMRLAFGEALKEDFDFYLWLNDDTKLYDSALSCMLDTFFSLLEKTGHPVIVAGSVCDGDALKLTYGGFSIRNGWSPARYEMIQPSGEPQKCDLFNGNCVMIPREIAEAVGNISSGYRHGAGDFDYALAAGRAGFSSWVCPGFVGTCSKNKMIEQWKTAGLSMQERVRALNNPVITARVKDWIIYAKRNHKISWPYFYITCLIRLRLPRLYILLKIRS